MLNPETNQRELCYIVRVDSIEPIPGKDRVESATVNGWHVMVPIHQFKPGSLGIYFEIDSKVDTSKPYFAFLEKRNGKIKTQKFKAGDGHFYSQGLLMAPEDFGWESILVNDKVVISTGNGLDDYYEEGDFLTKDLGVVYADEADNKRKANSVDKYKKMVARHPKLFQNPLVKKLYKTSWGKRILFVFFGKKKDKRGAWPVWVVKTDEERIQNLTHMIPSYCEESWVATEKVDGTSTTFTLRGEGRKKEFYVCSRNVVFDKPDKKCFYETNVYTEMAEKYNMEDVLTQIKKDMGLNFITIQGETYGGNIQKRDYSTKEHDLAVFNVIFGNKDGSVVRLNPYDMKYLMDKYNVPCVPIIGTIDMLPDTCQGILDMAHGDSQIDGLWREGIVFRSLDGTKSFKAVDNEFLTKYHG